MRSWIFIRVVWLIMYRIYLCVDVVSKFMEIFDKFKIGLFNFWDMIDLIKKKKDLMIWLYKLYLYNIIRKIYRRGD